MRNLYIKLLSVLLLAAMHFSAIAQSGRYQWQDASSWEIVEYDKCSGKLKIKMVLGDKDAGNDDYHLGSVLSFRDKNGAFKDFCALSYSPVFTYDGHPLGANEVYEIEKDNAYVFALNNYVVAFDSQSYWKGYGDHEGDVLYSYITLGVPSELIGREVKIKLDLKWGSKDKVYDYWDYEKSVYTSQEQASTPTEFDVSNNCNGNTISYVIPNSGCAGTTSVEIWRNNTLFKTTSESSYNDNVPLGSGYKYKVRAVFTNDAGIKNFSSFTQERESSISTKPSTPTNLEAIQDKCGVVQIVWSQSQNQDSYTLSRSLDGNNYTGLSSDIPKYSTTFDDESIANGIEYYYSIKASNSCGESANSQPISITTFNNAATPTGFTASYISESDKIKLTWGSPEPALGFKIFRGILEIADIEGDKLEYYDGDIQGCTDYTYSIEAYTDCNTSSSVNASITTPGETLSTFNMKASDGKFPNRVELEWDVVGAASEYRIYRDEQIINTLPGANSNSYLDYDVFPGDYYTYTVMAMSECPAVSSEEALDVGFILPNGKITGHISTENGTFVENVEVKITPTLGTALEFNGQDSKIQIPDADQLQILNNSFTVESWIKLNDYEGIGSDRTILGAPAFELLNEDVNVKVQSGTYAGQMRWEIINSSGQKVLESREYSGGLNKATAQVEVYAGKQARQMKWVLSDSNNNIIKSGDNYSGYDNSGQAYIKVWAGSKANEMSWKIRNKNTGEIIGASQSFNPNSIVYFDWYDYSSYGRDYGYYLRIYDKATGNWSNWQQYYWDKTTYRYLNPGNYTVRVAPSNNYNAFYANFDIYGPYIDNISGQTIGYGSHSYFDITVKEKINCWFSKNDYPLPAGTYEFIAEDSGNDGWNDGGYFEVYVNNSRVLYEEVSGSGETHEFVIPESDNNTKVYDETLELDAGTYTFKAYDKEYESKYNSENNWYETYNGWEDGGWYKITSGKNTTEKQYVTSRDIDEYASDKFNKTSEINIPESDNNKLLIDTTLALPPGDYTFIAYDDAGDGWNDNGWFAIDLATGTDIAQTNPTGAKFSKSFTVKGKPMGGLHYVIRDKKPHMSFYENDLTSTTEIPLDQWQHIAFRYDKDNAEQAIFINGEMTDQKLNSAPYTGNGELNIGSWFGAHFFNGSMDEFRIWNTSRTNSEIKRDYQRTMNGDEDGLVVYYRFDENVGEIAYDMTTEDPNDFHGYFTNCAWTDDKSPVFTSGFTDSLGNYVIDKVNYGGIYGQTFNVVPFGESRTFNPQNQQRTLDPSQKIADGVNFTDISTFPVSGTTMYANTQCYISNAEILVDGKSATPPARTDGNGFWSTDVLIGNHSFEVLVDTLIGAEHGYSFVLNGVDNFLRIPDNESLHFTDKFTLSTWFKWNGASGINTIFSKSSGGDIPELNIAIDQALNRLVIKMDKQTSEIRSAGFITPNEWTHMALVFDRTLVDNRIKIYLNGAVDNRFTGTADTAALTANRSALFIGYNSQFSDQKFNGNIDETTIWNTALTEAQILNLYENNIDTKENSLVGYYKFDNESETEIKDYSENTTNNNAIVHGTAQWDTDGVLSQKAVYYDFQAVNERYNPKSTQYKFYIDGPKLNLDFDNVTTFKASGKVTGRCDFSIGTSNVILKSLPECFTDTVYNVTKDFVFDSIPPLNYTVEVKPHDITKQIPVQSINLEKKDTVIEFLYRAPMQVAFNTSEKAKSLCENYNVFEQWVPDTVYIEVFESYNGQHCPVDSATVFVYDDIAGRQTEPDTMLLNPDDKGFLKYLTLPAFPNISPDGDNPFQKKIDVFTIDANQRDASGAFWALIKGTRPRPQTFTTRLPAIPFLILRDPPGDGSYAYWEKGTTHTTSFSVDHVRDRTHEHSINLSLGPTFEIETGLLVSTGKETDIVIDESKDLTFTSTSSSSDELQLSFTANETITTSDDELYVGEEMDVYVGSALNVIYGAADELVIDGCTPTVQKSIYMSLDTLSTTFIYTAKHIREEVIPGLELLMNDTLTRGTPELADTTAANAYQADIDAWNSMLDKNQQLKDEAVFSKNISFSYGATYEASETSEESKSTTTRSESYFSSAGSLALGFYTGGMGADTKHSVQTEITTGKEQTAEDATTTTIGYVLDDNDPGDFFSINILKDPVYKTPVFETVAGESMCPNEANTVPREGVRLTIEGAISGSNSEIEIPADQSAVFIVGIQNTSMSEEGSNLGLSIVQGSNPHGADIKINGVSTDEHVTFRPDANQTMYATLTVDKGPLEYEYSDLKINLFSKCEYDLTENGSSYSTLYGDDGTTVLNTTYQEVNFNAFFQKPCIENLSLLQPEPHWVFNMQNKINQSDTMHVFFTSENFSKDMKNTLLEKVLFEYAPINTNDPYPVLGAETFRNDVVALGEAGNYAHQSAYLGNLDDGQYNVRITGVCSNDTRSSSDWINGSLFRKAPVVFGLPQPQDNILSANDIISVSFDKNIDCEAIKPHNARLRGKLSGIEYEPTSLFFDGMNDYMVLNNDSANDIYQFNDTTDFSIEFWFKSAKSNWEGRPAFITNKDLSSLYNKGFAVYGMTDGVSLGVNIADGTNSIDLNAGNISDEQWHYIAITAKRPQETGVNDELANVFVYVDFDLKAQANISDIGSLDTELPLVVAQDATLNFSNYFAGYLDEIRLWNTAKSKASLLETWKTTLLGNEDNLIACWRLDQKGGTEQKAREITGYFEQAVITDATWKTGEEDAAPIKADNIEEIIPVTTSCYENTILMVPNINQEYVENSDLTAVLNGIKDLYGNKTNQIEWSFFVDQNAVSWEHRIVDHTKYADSTYTFSVLLSNNGPANEPYWLQQLPEWLEVAEMQGNLAAFESKLITFTVPEWVGNGDYSAEIKAQTINGWEPLTINLRVICTPPSVDNDFSAFEYSMNMVAQLNVNGDLSQDSYDHVRAYQNNELCGFGHIQYEAEVDKYLTYLTLYSNSTGEQSFDFYIWDASECLDYVGIQETITFVPDTVIGDAANPYELSTNQEVQQIYALNEGWNWKTFNLNLNQITEEQASGMDINTLLNGSFNENDLVKGQENYAYFSNNEWVGALTEIDNQNTFQFFANSPTQFVVKGYPIPSKYKVPVTSGWNWIGYPPNKYMEINYALSSVQFDLKDGDIIKSRDEFAQFVEGTGWIGSLKYLAPHQGYLMNIAEIDDDIVFKKQNHIEFETENAPSINVQMLQQQKADFNNYVKNSTNWTITAQQYQFSMNVTAEVFVDDLSINDSTVILGAFVGDECRGVAHPVRVGEKNVYFLTIFSNVTNENVIFRTYLPEDQVDLASAETVLFGSNAIKGSPEQPVELTFAFRTDHSPLLAAIPNQQTHEGGTFNAIDLNTYLTELDGDVLAWEYSTNSALEVQIDANGMLTVNAPDINWNGEAEISVKVKDTNTGLKKEALQTITYSALAIDDAPVLSDIPEQVIEPGQMFTIIDLHDYLTEVDNDEITWTIEGNSQLNYELSMNRLLIVTPKNAQWTGREELSITVTDKTTSRFMSSTKAAYKIKSDIEGVVNQFAFANVHPNPFKERTEIVYTIPTETQVSVEIYNLAGMKVSTLFEGTKAAGTHTIEWNTKDHKNGNTDSGIYVCKIKTATNEISTKLILIK